MKFTVLISLLALAKVAKPDGDTGVGNLRKIDIEESATSLQAYMSSEVAASEVFVQLTHNVFRDNHDGLDDNDNAEEDAPSVEYDLMSISRLLREGVNEKQKNGQRKRKKTVAQGVQMVSACDEGLGLVCVMYDKKRQPR
jgi:hypothetical protein